MPPKKWKSAFTEQQFEQAQHFRQNYSTLHHHISRTKLDLLAEALHKVLTNQKIAEDVKLAADSFWSLVKEKWHGKKVLGRGDKLDQQETMLAIENVKTQLHNLPFNFEMGYGEPLQDAGEDFDPGIEEITDEAATKQGFRIFKKDRISEALERADALIEHGDPTSCEFWENLSSEMDVAHQAFFEEAQRRIETIRWSSPNHWHVSTRAQKLRVGTNIEKPDIVFAKHGNLFPKPPEIVNFPVNWMLVLQQQPNCSVVFDINLKHIAERHTLPFFTFNVQSRNSFFPNVTDLATLKQAVIEILSTQFLPAFYKHLNNQGSGDGPAFQRCDGLYFSGDYTYVSAEENPDLGDEVEANSDESELPQGEYHYWTLKTLAPEGPDAIWATKVILDEHIKALGLSSSSATPQTSSSGNPKGQKVRRQIAAGQLNSEMKSGPSQPTSSSQSKSPSKAKAFE